MPPSPPPGYAYATVIIEPKHCTRGNDCKLHKLSYNTRIREKNFAVRAINNRNALPQEVASAPSLNAFENALDKFWEKLQLNFILKQTETFVMTYYK